MSRGLPMIAGSPPAASTIQLSYGMPTSSQVGEKYISLAERSTFSLGIVLRIFYDLMSSSSASFMWG